MEQSTSKQFRSNSIFNGDHAEARLPRLGIPGTEPLVEALRAGVSGYRSTNADHPNSYKGSRMWGETTSGLRRALRPYGWERGEHVGLDVVMLPSAGRAIVVTAGAGGTGDPRYPTPQVRYKRKAVMTRLVNQTAARLFEEFINHRPIEEVWCLLHHVRTDHVDAELSQPGGIDREGFVTFWHERILLPRIDLAPIARVETPAPAPDPSVNIARRR